MISAQCPRGRFYSSKNTIRKNRKVAAGNKTSSICEPLERRLLFQAVLSPQIPAGTFPVTSFGAVGDGSTNNVQAFASAIAAAEQAGGGTVDVPFVPNTPNVYVSAPITLNTSINLQIDPGVTLQELPYNLVPLIATNSEVSFINGLNISNFEITGGGTIAGNASTWPAGVINAAGQPLLNFTNVQIAAVQNVSISNSADGNLFFEGSTANITISGVTISTSASLPSTEGIDISGSANATIENCNIGVGGNDISILDGDNTATGTTIENCNFTSGGGVANYSGGILLVTNGTFSGTTYGIQLLGVPANLSAFNQVYIPISDSFSDLTMTNVQTPVLIDVYYNDGNLNLPADPSAPLTTPSPNPSVVAWAGTVFQNITSIDSQPGSDAGIFYGSAANPVGSSPQSFGGGLLFTNAHFTSNIGMQIDHVAGLSFDSACSLSVASGSDLFGTSDGKFPEPYDAAVSLAGYQTWTDNFLPSSPGPLTLYDPGNQTWLLSSNLHVLPDPDNENRVLDDTGAIAPQQMTLRVDSVTNSNPSSPDGYAGIAYSLIDPNTSGDGGVPNNIKSLYVDAKGNVLFDDPGDDHVITMPTGRTTDVWLRLEMDNPGISAFYSLDGTNWIELGHSDLGGYGGGPSIAVDSSLNNVVTAVFSNVSTVAPGTDQPPVNLLVPSSDLARLTPSTSTASMDARFVTDDGGISNLTGSWTQTSGPVPVVFLANGITPGAVNNVLFSKAGTYSFNVSIADAQGQVLSGAVQSIVTGQTNIVVPQVPTYILVAPLVTAISGSTSEQLAATEYDQFGDPMATQPSFAWSLGNGSVGTIDSTTGQYAANGVPGSATATVTADGITANAVVNVPAPTFAVSPHATSSPVTTTSTTLSALGASVDGESNLAYTWTLAAGPAPVTFGDNNDNTAKNVTATFTTSGVYQFVCALTDPAGIVTQQTVSVPVVRTETSIFVSPASTYSFNSGLRVFKAVALDQFGAKLAKQPKFTWSVAAGSLGTVSRAGVYHAPKTGGTFSVVATSGSLQGSASVVVGVRQGFAWLSDSDFLDAYLAANPKLTKYVDRLLVLHPPPAILQ